MAAAVNYLVGIRFEAYGSLLRKMGGMQSMLGNLEKSNKSFLGTLIKVGAVGVAAFAVLTREAEKYNSALIRMEGLQVRAQKQLTGQAFRMGGAPTGYSPVALMQTETSLRQVLGGSQYVTPAATRQFTTMQNILRQWGMGSDTARTTLLEQLRSALLGEQQRGLKGSAAAQAAMRDIAQEFVTSIRIGGISGGRQTSEQYQRAVQQALESPYLQKMLSPQQIVTTLGRLASYKPGMMQSFQTLTGLGVGGVSNMQAAQLMQMGVPIAPATTMQAAISGHRFAIRQDVMRQMLTHPGAFALQYLLPAAERAAHVAPMPIDQLRHNKQAYRAVQAVIPTLYGGDSAVFGQMLQYGLAPGRAFRAQQTAAVADPYAFMNKLLNKSIQQKLRNLEAAFGKLADSLGRLGAPAVIKALDLLTHLVGGIAHLVPTPKTGKIIEKTSPLMWPLEITRRIVQGRPLFGGAPHPHMMGPMATGLIGGPSVIHNLSMHPGRMFSGAIQSQQASPVAALDPTSVFMRGGGGIHIDMSGSTFHGVDETSVTRVVHRAVRNGLLRATQGDGTYIPAPLSTGSGAGG